MKTRTVGRMTRSGPFHRCAVCLGADGSCWLISLVWLCGHDGVVPAWPHRRGRKSGYGCEEAA
jgi:hypothetical protein